MKLIKNVKMILIDKVISGSILFTDKIKALIKEETAQDFEQKIKNLKETYGEIDIIDGGGCYLAPGFIDIHIHGSAGSDTMDASIDDLVKIKRSLIKSGVTSFLATTTTMAEERIKSALNAIKKEIKKEKVSRGDFTPGARLIGCHLEGPFINEEYKGAQASQYIVPPDIKLIEEYKDIINLVTLAPEINGAQEMITYLKENNIIASAGHTAATYDDIIKARQWGLKHTTHLFNGMTKFHHRNPGIIGAVLTTDMSCEIIADFIHLHPAVIKVVLQAKKLENIILVTDQMKAASLDDGSYLRGGRKIIVKNGSARLENGCLAGSVLTLDRAVRNIKKISDLDIYKIINMVSYNPACLLGMDDEIGSIREGNRADFVLLNDKLEVLDVYRDGRQFSI